MTCPNFSILYGLSIDVQKQKVRCNDLIVDLHNKNELRGFGVCSLYHLHGLISKKDRVVEFADRFDTQKDS